MTSEQKEKIDRYIQIYLNGLQSVSNDAGWETCGIMGKLVDFVGDLPPPSGNDQSNLGMINAIQLLRERHAKMPVIAAAVASLLRSRREQIMALLARHYYVGVCPYTEKPWNDAQRGEEIGQEIDAYRYNLKKSYQLMQMELESAERYREFFGLAAS